VHANRSSWFDFMNAPKLNPLTRDEQSSRCRSSQDLNSNLAMRYNPVHAWSSVSQLTFTFSSTRFYRAMHYSAKSGIEIACRLSVRPSVCLSVCLSVCVSVCDVGGSGPHRLEIWKLSTRTISPTPSLFVAQRSSTYAQGNMGKFWKD